MKYSKHKFITSLVLKNVRMKTICFTLGNCSKADKVVYPDLDYSKLHTLITPSLRCCYKCTSNNIIFNQFGVVIKGGLRFKHGL